MVRHRKPQHSNRLDWTSRARAGNGSDGFTLIELLVAIAIAALLASLAMPTAAAYLQRHRLTAAAQDLADAMAAAREAATLSGTPRWLVLQQGPNWCWAVARSANCGCASPEPCQLQRVSREDQGSVAQLSLNGDTPSPLRFDPVTSRMRPPDVRIGLESAAQTIQVRMSPLGRVEVCSGGRTASGTRAASSC